MATDDSPGSGTLHRDVVVIGTSAGGLTAQSEALEAALWASVRSLEESAQLADRLAAGSDRNLSQRFRDKADALRQHAGLIQDVLLHGTTLDAEDATLLEVRASLES